MDIQGFLMRLFNEQKWREEQAKKLSTGFGDQPMDFKSKIELQYPLLMDTFRSADNKDARREKVINSMERTAQSPLPDWFHERWRQKEWNDQRQQSLQDIFKRGM